MKKTLHPDILGMALQDFFAGNTSARIIIHSPEFDNDCIDVSHYFRDYKAMPEIERQALQLCRGCVLDIGAGAGSHALYLQEKGFEVTCMDISRGACEIMKQRGLRKVRNENLFNYKGKKIDTILMMMNGIGIVGNLEGLKKYLEILPSFLNSGGRLIFDSTNLIYLFADDDGTAWIDLNKNYYGEVSFEMEYKDFISSPFGWLYVDDDIIASLCSELGYEFKLIYRGENFHYLSEITL